MKYLNERHVSELGIEWPALVSVIDAATRLIPGKSYCQPLKPYLRFNDPANRIIAMPAYVGSPIDAAGIKWIASFPGNLSRQIKRAHSVLILNDTVTGAPTALINTALISAIRTAAVSAFVLGRYLEDNPVGQLDCGIIGFGPIGQLHLEMLLQQYGDRIGTCYLYDLRPIALSSKLADSGKVTCCNNWQEVYEQAGLLFTCTVSKERYIDAAPKKGGLYFNISLRDFQPAFLRMIDVHAVDDWGEICREQTDIEKAHQAFGLDRSDVLEIADLLPPGSLAGLPEKSFMFNPMGMAIFDIAVGKHYYDRALHTGQLIDLED